MFQSLHDFLYHYTPTGGVGLKSTGIVVGIALIITHLIAWMQGDAAKAFLKAFPRTYKWGVILGSIAFLWGMMCLNYMDMGEFFYLRPYFLWIVPISFVLVLVYVPEFLSVRALGCLLLLLAGPVLQAAFLQPPATRLLLPVLAYSAWIIPGMYCVGMPFLLRDAIGWITATPQRWLAACAGGVVYGVLILIAAIVFW
jgi:hypothetical protein